jgi:RNA ligase (TIGR02306 family)
MADSTHRVEVVPVTLEPHPNADSLSVVKVFDGYYVCVRTADWIGKDIGAYVPPDSIVPETEQFAFLQGKNRIKVKRLRGVISMGLLVPAPEGSKIGDDVAELLGVTHYDPPMPLSTGGESIKPPPGYHPVYDVESLRRYASAFISGELCMISEKLHGSSSRFVYLEESGFHCGSRNEWKADSEANMWWRVLRETTALQEFLKANPGVTVYGEVYGQVQDLRYGTQKGEIRFAAFDILIGSRWLDAEEARAMTEPFRVPWVPVISRAFPFELERVLELAEGPSLVLGAEHIREGCVVKPVRERTDPLVGRVCLKVVGNSYMERA